MPEFRTLGIVLKRSNFGEADRILTILTPDHGLVSALAKGLKKIKSHRAGTLELFRLAEVQLHRRSGELFLVTTASPRSDIVLPTDDLEAVGAAFEVAEWVVRLVPPEKPLSEVFALVRETLMLCASGHKRALIVVAFQIKLLTLLGFLPEVTVDTRANRVIRFCTAASWHDITQLAYEPETCAAIARELATVFTAITDRELRSSQVTRSWGDV